MAGLDALQRREPPRLLSRVNSTLIKARSSSGSPRRPSSRGFSNDGGEFLEELVGQLLGRRVDESTAELRQPAAHFCLGLVSHQRAFAVVREMHGRAAAGVARDAARTLPG